MKAEELIKKLRRIPKDAEVYLCKDWEECDEDGNLVDLYRLDDVIHQKVIVDLGMDFRTDHEIILSFENTRAHAEINDDML